jgi:hypothetical protein
MSKTSSDMKAKVRHLFGPFQKLGNYKISHHAMQKSRVEIVYESTGEHLEEIPTNKFNQTLVPSRLLRASSHILPAYSG